MFIFYLPHTRSVYVEDMGLGQFFEIIRTGPKNVLTFSKYLRRKLQKLIAISKNKRDL